MGEDAGKVWIFCHRERTSEAIFYSSFTEQDEGNQRTSVPFGKPIIQRGEAVRNLIKALNLFPVKIRKYISWNTNVRKLTETEDYEWNFLRKAVLEEIEASGFAGGRAVKRIILCDKSVIRFPSQRSIDNAWIRFVEQYNEKGQQADGLWMTETRERFAFTPA